MNTENNQIYHTIVLISLVKIVVCSQLNCRATLNHTSFPCELEQIESVGSDYADLLPDAATVI